MSVEKGASREFAVPRRVAQQVFAGLGAAEIEVRVFFPGESETPVNLDCVARHLRA